MALISTLAVQLLLVIHLKVLTVKLKLTLTLTLTLIVYLCKTAAFLYCFSQLYHTFKNAAQKVSVPLAFHFTVPSSPPSDCWRLRFSLRVDIVRLINSHIIIIIMVSSLRVLKSVVWCRFQRQTNVYFLCHPQCQ